MHFSWFMHLFIVLLFSRHSSGNNWHSSYIDEEDESSTISIDSYEETKKPDYDEQLITKTTTEHNAHLHEDNVDYYPSHEDESEDEEDNSTTTFSSSSDIVLTTNVITGTMTSKIETTTTTTTTTTATTTVYDIDEQMFTKTTLDPQQIAFYIAKTNRERFLLQMFAITVAIGMSSLAIVLFTIHLRRKRRRYHGYRAPTNTLPKKQSIHSNNLNI